MEYIAFPDQDNTGAWRVEAINYDGEGEAYVAIFCGSNAQTLAEEYAAFKNA